MKSLNEIVSDPNLRDNLARRFWEKVNVGKRLDCWKWKAKARTSFGYGRMTAGRGVNLKAHRVAWALEYGPIPDGLCVLHECDNPSCCNPAHLFIGTKRDNTRDMMRKDRMSPPPTHFGPDHPNSKLSLDQERTAAADPRPAHVVAAAFGVSTKTIYRMRHRRI